MPAQDWTVFLQAHYRPHLLVVDLGAPSKGFRGKRVLALLGQLARSLQTSADYAVCCDGEEIKVAFESDLDARILGKLLMARTVDQKGQDWASKAVCNLNSRLKTVRRPKGRQGQKLKLYPKPPPSRHTAR